MQTIWQSSVTYVNIWVYVYFIYDGLGHVRKKGYLMVYRKNKKKGKKLKYIKSK